jgi:uncharacterized protein YoxC
MNALPLWVLAAAVALGILALLRLSKSLNQVQHSLDDLRGDLARLTARTELLEHQLNQSWQIVEQRIGRIHQIFESGQACRVGTTLSQFDLKIGQLNRKIEDLLDRMPRSGRTSTEAS